MNKTEFRALVEKRLADKVLETNNLTYFSIRSDFGGKLDDFADFVAVIKFTKAGYFRYIEVCTWNYCDEKLEGHTFMVLNAGQMHLQFKEVWPSITQAETAALIGCSQGLVSYHLKKERAKMRMGFNACNEAIKRIEEYAISKEDLKLLEEHTWHDRGYNKHICYARMMDYGNNQLHELSGKIIANDSQAKFSEEYNMSHTDVYDFASAKNRHAWYDLKKGTVYDVYNGQGEKMFRATYKTYLEWDEECVFVVCGTYLYIENHELFDLEFEEVEE